MEFILNRSAIDPLEPFATGSFRAVQLNHGQKPFVAFGNVPKGVIHRMLKLTFNFKLVIEKRPFKALASISGFAASCAEEAKRTKGRLQKVWVGEWSTQTVINFDLRMNCCTKTAKTFSF